MSDTPKKTVAEIEAEIKATELELKRAELAEVSLRKRERELNLRDLEQRVSKHEIKDQQFMEDRAARARVFATDDATDRLRWSQCTHKKGGMASNRDMRVLSTGGNSNFYAVIKHQMINGDIWVRCQRCGKTWSPPVEANFYFNDKGIVVPAKMGKFDRVAFDKAQAEYRQATMFETNNTMSGSVQCRFYTIDENGRQIDATDKYRESIKDSTLR